MIIKRKPYPNAPELNIELKPNELIKAYYEQQHLFDIADIKEEIESNDFESEYKCSYDTAVKYIDEMAEKKRWLISHYGTDCETAVRDAIRSVLREHGEYNE